MQLYVAGSVFQYIVTVAYCYCSCCCRCYFCYFFLNTYNHLSLSCLKCFSRLINHTSNRYQLLSTSLTLLLHVFLLYSLLIKTDILLRRTVICAFIMRVVIVPKFLMFGGIHCHARSNNTGHGQVAVLVNL